MTVSVNAQPKRNPIALGRPRSAVSSKTPPSTGSGSSAITNVSSRTFGFTEPRPAGRLMPGGRYPPFVRDSAHRDVWAFSRKKEMALLQLATMPVSYVFSLTGWPGHRQVHGGEGARRPARARGVTRRDSLDNHSVVESRCSVSSGSIRTSPVPPEVWARVREVRAVVYDSDHDAVAARVVVRVHELRRRHAGRPRPLPAPRRARGRAWVALRAGAHDRRAATSCSDA